MGSDASRNPSFFIARVYDNSSWRLCKPYSYSESSSSFIPASSIAKIGNTTVYFDDGTEPTVKKENTLYQPAKSAYYDNVVCGTSRPTGGIFTSGDGNAFSIAYYCDGCGETFGEYSTTGYVYDGPCEPKTHYKRGSYHPASPETAGTRSYNINWKNQLATITLTELEMNSEKYEEYIGKACLFASDNTEDSLIIIHPDNTVEIEWYGAGVESGHCDKTWTF